MTPAGIEPATFWFVAKHLNHCATAVSLSLLVLFLKLDFLYLSTFIVSYFFIPIYLQVLPSLSVDKSVTNDLVVTNINTLTATSARHILSVINQTAAGSRADGQYWRWIATKKKTPVCNLAEHSGFFTRSDADETEPRVPTFEYGYIVFR